MSLAFNARRALIPDCTRGPNLKLGLFGCQPVGLQPIGISPELHYVMYVRRLDLSVRSTDMS